MKHHVIPLHCKEQSFVTIHAGTNDASYSTAQKLLDKLLTLKYFITGDFPNVKVAISKPTLCTDNGKAALTVSQLTNHHLQVDIDIDILVIEILTLEMLVTKPCT